DGGALGREAGIDEDERTPLGIVHRNQFHRTFQDWFDIFGAAPEEWYRPRRPHQLLDFVVGDIGRSRPEREHILGINVVVQGLKCRLPVRNTAYGGGRVARHDAAPGWPNAEFDKRLA